ncbi:MAG: 5-formyltetrahydrofolate cyclo-ligase [Nitrospirae bacterium]|nr:5-formyltetrahydrofolate cyclo-ligase [Nitrospirota bacterium]
MKKALRERLLKKRNRIGLQEKKVKEAAIRKRLYASADFKKAKSMLFYASFRSEVDTMTCIAHTLKLKKNVVLPRVENKKEMLRLFAINNISEIEPGYMGIPEPVIRTASERKLNDIDIVIVPGAGFDKNGNRLGYGAGYYDKLFSGIRDQGSGVRKEKLIPNPQPPKPVLIALAFEEQIASEIPSEKHDVKMDRIITEKRTIVCRKKEINHRDTEAQRKKSTDFADDTD